MKFITYFKTKWFKVIIFALIIIQTITFKQENSKQSFAITSQNSDFFLKKKNYSPEREGIGFTIYDLQLYFPEFVSKLHHEAEIPSIDEVIFDNLGIKTKDNFKNNRANSQDALEIISSNYDLISIVTYGNLTNEIFNKINNMSFTKTDTTSLGEKNNQIFIEKDDDNINSVNLSIDGLHFKESLIDDLEIIDEIKSLLLKNEKQDSLLVRFKIDEEYYEYYEFPKTAFNNLFNANLGVFSIFTQVLFYKIIYFLIIVSISFIFTDKLKTFRKEVEKVIFFYLIFFLIYINIGKLVLIPFSLDINQNILSMIGILELHLIFLLVCLIPKPLKRYSKIKYFLWILPIIIYFFKNFMFIYFVLIFIIFTMQIKRESRFQRKIRRSWLKIGFLPLPIGIILLTTAIFVKNKFALNIQEDPFNMAIIMLIVILYAFMSLLLPFFTFLFSFIKFDFKKYVKIRSFVYFTLIFIFFFLILRLLLLRYFHIPSVITIVISYFLALQFHKKVKFLHPLPFDKTKEIANYLTEAFGKLSLEELFKYSQMFLSNRFKIKKFAYISDQKMLGFEFTKRMQLINKLPNKYDYFNLDIERINESDESLPFPEEPNEDEIKLFYPIRNDNNEIEAHICIGDAGKLFWTQEEADFIKDITKIFNKTLNNIKLNKTLREKQVSLEKEQEEKRVQELYAEELESKNIQINEEKKKLTDSIEYASLIQDSILPREEDMFKYIKDFFIIWKPRDIVGGDFYWFFPIPDSKNYIISVIDCTGHGVPGAFMSMTANSILNNIVREKKIYEPDKILNLLHKEIRYTLRQQSKESQQDGMDLSLCLIDVESQKIHFAGAMQSIYFVGKRRKGKGEREKEIERIRGNRFSIGGKQKEEERLFTKHIIQFNSGDSIYLLSDGLPDQKVRINGKEQRLKTKRVSEMFLKYYSLSMKKQKDNIEEELAELQGKIEQRDDIVMVGVNL
ncbi:MAG: SpoIIE family protein phosphatase [Candidatus Cloacimonetes bacterium]|nr:SpoIIE family protein phosphatase [Candidatus Cloacimonadota bacterium]